MLRLLKLFLSISLILPAPVGWGADLDLSPLEIFKCWRALKRLNTKTTPTIPTALSKKLGNYSFSVPTYTKLTPTQIEEMFSSYPEGANATAFGVAYRTVDGSLTVLFWPQKPNAAESSITFRDAAETIIESELRAIKKYLSEPRNEKLQILLDAQENLTRLLEEVKNNPQIPQELTERFIGLQIRAKKSDQKGALKIESIDFDPTFNGRSSISSLFGWTEEIQAVMNKISSSISPKYRPEVYRIDDALFNSYLGPLKLKAPIGSLISSFSEK